MYYLTVFSLAYLATLVFVYQCIEMVSHAYLEDLTKMDNITIGPKKSGNFISNLIESIICRRKKKTLKVNEWDADDTSDV
jgi:hypothetical protein